jgi:hypothetical protein
MKTRSVRPQDAELPPAFSLLRSEFGDFLYAAIDVDDAKPLTLLSAFTRAGMDPWREAATLCTLPPETARQRLAVLIAALPEHTRSMDEALSIAGRLIASLPPRPSLAARLVAATRGLGLRLSRPFAR